MSKSKKSKKDQLGLGDELLGTRLGEARDRTPKKSGTDLFIIDNSDEDWKVRDYLHDWCQLSQSIDIATGFFEIGSLLALDGEWQKVDKFRILMGDEVSLRTKKVFDQGLENITHRLDSSIETEKENNDFLVGVPAIVEAIKSKKIECKVYRENKFHAKAYITRARQEVIGSFGLVGSSNFTLPGLSNNVELNVQITGRQVNALQEWYEEYWENAEDVSPEILRVIEYLLDLNYTSRPDIDVYPKIKAHLLRFKKLLENRPTPGTLMSAFSHGMWWVLTTSRRQNFSGPKIVAPQRSPRNTFGYNEILWYAASDVFYITEKDRSISLKYILSLINSKLYYLWLYHRGKRKGETLELIAKPLSEIPIKKLVKTDQKPFISIADKILTITKDDDYLSNTDKQAEVKELEREIDQMVYKLYELTPEEIAVVEGGR